MGSIHIPSRQLPYSTFSHGNTSVLRAVHRVRANERAVKRPCVPASFSYTFAIMPRDGARLLSDVTGPVLTVVCEPCGRCDRYDVERLIRQYGWEMKMPELLAELVADCPKRGSVSVYDRCKAVFERWG